METFVLVIVGILALETVAKIYFLSIGKLVPRTTQGEVGDIVFAIVLMIWATSVLSK